MITMNTSPLLNLYADDDAINEKLKSKLQEKFVSIGYLDDVLAIFERHGHPFVLVGILAMRWSGTRELPDREIDVLMQASKLQAITDDLVDTGKWTIIPNPYDPETHRSYTNTTTNSEIWLESCEELTGGFGLCYLRLFPEELYKLSVEDCDKVEIPDIFAKQNVLLEEEYYRDPRQRFGPQRLSSVEAASHSVLIKWIRSKWARRDIPIFIPSIEAHLNALLDQWQEERETRTKNGNMPCWHIRNFVRYHVWDWPPASAWLLENKVASRHQETMKSWLEGYVRKPFCTIHRETKKLVTFYPWDLPL